MERETCGTCRHGGEPADLHPGWRICHILPAEVDKHIHKDDEPCPHWVPRLEPQEYRPGDGPFWMTEEPLGSGCWDIYSGTCRIPEYCGHSEQDAWRIITTLNSVGKTPQEYCPGDGPWWAERVGQDAWEIKALVYDTEYFPLPRLSEVNARANVKMLNRVCRDWAKKHRAWSDTKTWNDARREKPPSNLLVLVCYNANSPCNNGLARWNVPTHPDQWEVYFPEMCDYETNTIYGGDELVTHWSFLPPYPFIFEV